MSSSIASQLHQESIIIDGLNASWFPDPRVLQHLHEGGVTAVNATIAAWHDPLETLDLFSALLPLFEQHSDIIMQVESVEDIAGAKESGRVGMILGFQDTAPIADNLGLLSVHYKLGVRIIQLTYNHENLVGYGCQAPEDGGLTGFGREVVAEMNRLGILVDVSHCGPRTTLEAIETSTTPIAITHANPLALLDMPRNKSDEVIRALAERGGVIGAVQFPAMVTRQFPATVETYVDVIDHLVRVAGIDHVGLGPDFMEYMPAEVAAAALKGLPPEAIKQFAAIPPMQDFETAAKFPNVTAELLRRGYAPEDVKKIMGGNWLQLYEEVWT
ncbi:MAG: dipeptidase [Chloroflexota bacterium]|nr:dipeptidase [Chloroflexota bacterium]